VNLCAGAELSKFPEKNLVAVAQFLAACEILLPDVDTARFYGRVRVAFRDVKGSSILNNLWIAALCLQHRLPLLTNDRDFDRIEGLTIFRP
jgi:tRNA(fMet)-specific endonuclease VapC